MAATGTLQVTPGSGVQINTLAPSPGLGAMTAVPAGTTNGTALGTPPTTMAGARLYLPNGASVTFTVASAAPTAAPAVTFTASASTTGPNWDENLNGNNIYVTAITGTPLFRWF